MTTELLEHLEKKVTHAIEVIELLRLQIEELEEENIALKTEHDKWRRDLSALVKRLDVAEVSSVVAQRPRVMVKTTLHEREEDFMTV